MKILLVIGLGVAGLIALVVVVVLIGFLLPVKHKASVTARLSQSPEALWKALTDIQAFPFWRKDVKSITLLSATASGKPSWREEGKNGSMTYEILESLAPTKLVNKIADKNLPFGGSWTYEIAPVDGGSQITITENGEVYNPVFRFVSKFVMGHTATLEQYVKFLKSKFGE